MIDVLMFHRVLSKEQIDEKNAYFLRGTLISKERLEDVITQYLNNKYSFRRISDLNYESNENQVAFTFDDGYMDNYLHALPLLEKYKIKATFYPVVGYCKERKIAPLDFYYQFVNQYVDEEIKATWIIGAQKKKFIQLTIEQQEKFIKTLLLNRQINLSVEYMTLEQLIALQSLGHELGGHSYYHDIYTSLSEKGIYEDIKKTLNAFYNLGVKINSYAYTDGQYNKATIEFLKQENIQIGCTIKSQKITQNKNFEIERKFVTEHAII